MSYILDALKKAERQRRSESDAELMLSCPEEAPRKRRLSWPYVLIAALLLNAVILLAFFGPWKHPVRNVNRGAEKKIPVEVVKERFDLARPVIPESRAQRPEMPRQTGVAVSGRPKEPEGTPASGRKTEAPDRQKKMEVPLQRKSQREITPVPLDSRKTAADEKPAANRIYKLTELPQSVREALPELSLSLHLYNSEPGSRLINVAGKTLKEGQEFSPGVRVEHITPEGAVFSFQSYRFQVVMDSNR